MASQDGIPCMCQCQQGRATTGNSPEYVTRRTRNIRWAVAATTDVYSLPACLSVCLSVSNEGERYWLVKGSCRSSDSWGWQRPTDATLSLGRWLLVVLLGPIITRGWGGSTGGEGGGLQTGGSTLPVT